MGLLDTGRGRAAKVRTLALAGVIATVAVAAAGAALRPPYLTQAKPVYGDVTINAQDGKVWTYRGDWVMAVFDYDRVNGDPTVKQLPYTVCRVAGTAKQCVRRVWRGRPDIWMIRVFGDWVGSRAFFDFTWTAKGQQRGKARVWIYE